MIAGPTTVSLHLRPDPCNTLCRQAAQHWYKDLRESVEIEACMHTHILCDANEECQVVQAKERTSVHVVHAFAWESPLSSDNLSSNKLLRVLSFVMEKHVARSPKKMQQDTHVHLTCDIYFYALCPCPCPGAIDKLHDVIDDFFVEATSKPGFHEAHMHKGLSAA